MVKKISLSIPEHIYKWYIEPYENTNLSQHISKLITIGATAETDDFGKLRKEHIELSEKLSQVIKEKNLLKSEIGRLKEVNKIKKNPTYREIEV